MNAYMINCDVINNSIYCSLSDFLQTQTRNLKEQLLQEGIVLIRLINDVKKNYSF